MNTHVVNDQTPPKSWAGVITLVAALLGVVVGLWMPQVAAWVPSWIGDLFVRGLKLIAPPLVFLSCARALLSLGDLRQARKYGGRAALYYLSTSFLAACVGTLMSWLILGGETTDSRALLQERAPDVGPFAGPEFLEKLVPQDVISPLLKGEILQLITLALVFAVLILRRPESERVHWRGWVTRCDELVNDAAQGVLWFTPLAAFCLIATLIPSMNWSELNPFRSFLWAWGAASLAHGLVTLPLILWVMTRRSPLKFFMATRDALLVALTTASSAGTLPVSKRVLESNAGVSPESASFILPLGATLNMDGSAVYQAQLLLFMCVAEGKPMSFSLVATILGLVMFSSAGTSAIPRGGIAMMGMMILYLNLPIYYLSLYIIIDQILDYPITSLNVWGDLVGAQVIDDVLVQSPDISQDTPQIDAEDESRPSD